jgi:hypothetical protein
VHRHENKITTPRPCQDTRDQDLRRTSRQIKKAKTKTEKRDTTRRKASLAGQADLARTRAPPEESIQDIPTGPARTHEGKDTSPSHLTKTHVVDQCGVKPQSD